MGKVPEGLPGSTKGVACAERSVENLGGRIGSFRQPGTWAPERCLKRISGNCEVESATGKLLAGMPTNSKGRGAEDLSGVRLVHSTQGAGKPFTRGRD